MANEPTIEATLTATLEVIGKEVGARTATGISQMITSQRYDPYNDFYRYGYDHYGRGIGRRSPLVEELYYRTRGLSREDMLEYFATILDSKDREMEHLRHRSYYNQPFYIPTQETKALPLTTSEKKKYLVINSNAEIAFTPADNATYASIEEEATKLAKKFPKLSFTIFETKKTVKVEDKPITTVTYY